MTSNIIITHPDGSKQMLNSGSRITGITKAEQKVGLLSEDTVAITVNSATPLDFAVGDTVEVYGKIYTLNLLPTIKKTGTRKFTYELTFEGAQYDLIDVQFLLPDDTIGDSFTGDLYGFLKLWLDNVLRIFPGKWNIGEYPKETEYKTLSFSGKNCLEVAQQICDEYKQEFEITQNNGVKTFHIRKAGVAFPYTFHYGRTGGLYELTRKNINSKNVVTRLYAYGGSSNLGNSYRHSKLCLPGKKKNQSFIENAEAVAAFGIKENTKTFDKIYPNREGEVSKLGSTYYAFIDSTMNFDLNEKFENTREDYLYWLSIRNLTDTTDNYNLYINDVAGITTKWLIPRVSGKVKFITGNLAGYELEIHKYTHSTKEVQVIPFTDENGFKFPSETSAAFQFKPSDKYIFTEINLPDQYKTEAENDLKDEAETYYKQYCQPQVQYGLNIDQNFIKQFAGELTVVNLFAVGDYIQVKDPDIAVDKAIRITGFTRDLLQPYKYSLTLGDSVTQTPYTRIISDLQDIDEIIKRNDLTDASKARRNWRASQEVLSMVFDPEGDYYSEKIKPLSIETTMLQVGAKSSQFILQNVVFEPNYQGNANYLRVSAGKLIHYTIEENIRSWDIAQYSISNLVSATPYYIYARCSKTGTAGSIILDTTQRKVDHEATYYTFIVGVLNSAETDTTTGKTARIISLTYGSTTINGKFIRTGRINSTDGNNYFDLDSNQFRVGDTSSSLEWNRNSDRKLRLKGTFIQSPSGEESAAGVWRGEYSASKTYYQGDEVSYKFNGATSSYRRKGTSQTTGIVPTNTSYWDLYASQGGQGADGNNAAQIYYRSQFQPATPTGANPTGWKTNPSELNDTFGNLWRSNAIKNSAGNLVGTWSTPVLDEPYASNMLERFLWATGTGTTGKYAMNGNAAENKREILTTPLGFKDVIWRGICDGVLNAAGTNTDGDGGFTATISGIDATKPIRVSCWIMKKQTEGALYLGCSTASTLNISDNTANTNPYFFSGQPPTLNKWYLMIGYINASNDTDKVNNPLGGFYDPTTGKKVGNTFTTFKNKASVTTQAIRAYNFYCKKSGAEIQFWEPRVDIIDGREPGISDLLKKGAQGEQGPALVAKGAYSATKTYYGDIKTVDVVKYNNVWYKAKVTAGSFVGIVPTNTTYWETFGGSFESVATDTLFADGAYIGNWRIQSGQIVSTLNTSGNKVSLDANSAKIVASSTRTGGAESSGSTASTLTMDAISGLIEARSNNGVSYITANGIFSNSANTNAVSAVTGTTRKAAVVGLGYGTVNKSDWQNENFLAGVYGVASNSGNAPAYGGYFRDLFVAGLILHRQAYDNKVDAEYHLPNYASMVIGYSNKRTTVYLPNDGVMGKTIFFKQWWTGSIRIRAKGGQSLWDDHTKNDYFDIGEGQGAIFTFTIGYINGVKTEAWLFNCYKW